MSILARYLALAYLRMFLLAMTAATSLYLVIDVFDRIGEVLPFAPTWSAVLGYFLLKLPKILFDIFPAASLLAALVAIAALSRHREVLALRACGLSGPRIAGPMLVVALLLSVGALVWSENVVPVSASRSRWIWDVELKQKTYRGVFDAASLWFQDPRGFVHIRRYDAGERRISGMTVYETDERLILHRIIEVESMTWHEDGWVPTAGLVKELDGNAEVRVRPLSLGEFEMHEDPENLAARRRKPEEFSFRQLRRQIAQLEARGLGADEYLVDLHHKLAWPFAGLVVALVGIPLALRAGPRSGLAASTATGMVIGFAYWVITGLALSAGRTGALPPLAAAWASNVAFVALAIILLRRGESR